MRKLPITHVATTDISEMLDPVPGRRMELPGFDEEFVDFPDYIVRITERIWHERKVDLCLKYYAEDCVIHTLSGDIVGAQTVVDSTHATMASFPDRRLDADNVIWSDDGDEGLYSSHLITSKMTNDGASEFGHATGRKVRAQTIADCLCRENRICEEWLVRDYAAIVDQMGLDGDEVAASQAQSDIENDASLIDFHAPLYTEVRESSIDASAMPTEPEKEPVAFANAVMEQLWNQKDQAALPDIYDYRVAGHYPKQRNFYGYDEVGAFHADIFAAIPDVKVRVEHVCDIPYLDGARDISVRWSLAGTHTRAGLYGEPTGAPVVIMAVSQWRVINGRIKEEWTVWDDVAVRRQIATARLQK